MSESPTLTGLNNRQREAVTITSGSALVIAGAGSGKTSVLTKRVAYLIEQGVQPGNILCLTFTNKASREMNERVRHILTESGFNLPQTPAWMQDYTSQPLLSTFHSLGVRLLREFGEYRDLSHNFNILDTDDQKKIIREILKELDVDQKNLNPSLASYFISLCKQELLTADNSKRVSKEFLPIFHQIYRKYEERLKQNQTVDFDDLILNPYLILRDEAEVRSQLHDRWHHVMIDEFQDTNPAQFELVKLLAPADLIQTDTQRSVFVVGDDAQSIYAFRGSKIEIILNFGAEYHNTHEVVLNQNYRSTQPILDLAEKVISHNPFQKKKELFTENAEQVDIQYYLARNDRDEAEYIIKQLYKQYGNAPDTITDEVHIDADETTTAMFQTETPKATSSTDPVSSMFDVYLETDDFAPTFGRQSYNPQSWNVPEYNWSQMDKLNDCVVLYRTHAQSRSLEEQFLKYRLPYKLVSGVRFLDRKEVRDVVSILRYVINPQDMVSFSRWFPLVSSGVGPKTMQKIIQFIHDPSFPLAPKFQETVGNIQESIQHGLSNTSEVIKFTKDLLAEIGYSGYLKSEYPIKEEYQARMENIGEIYSLMIPFEQSDLSLEDKLKAFLEQVTLMSTLDRENSDNQPKISLMSLHQSKGLEFETVFMVGIEDGLLPHQNSLFEPQGLEEEVRLAYVGVTRAKKYLHLISADSRIQYGQVQANPVSRIFRPFLDTHCQRIR
jgi:DNA helicase-2/ATP-dependent DNA helicase PcrA